MSKHLFVVNSDTFDVSYSEEFKALKFTVKVKEGIRVLDRIATGVISLSTDHHYVFMQPAQDLPLISAPVDSGYLGDITLITSRPVSLPYGYTFYLMELVPTDAEPVRPENMGIKEPAYKGDIGRDTYLRGRRPSVKDVQFMLENKNGVIFFPRSSAAKKGYEVHVNNQYTTIRKADLSFITTHEAYSVVQLVTAKVSKFTDEVEFLTEENASELLENLMKKSERGTNKEGSSD